MMRQAKCWLFLSQLPLTHPSPPRIGSSNLLLPRGLTVAAALLAIVGWHVISSQWQPQVDQREKPQLLVIADGTKAMRFDDGSVVTLSGASTVAADPERAPSPSASPRRRGRAFSDSPLPYSSNGNTTQTI